MPERDAGQALLDELAVPHESRPGVRRGPLFRGVGLKFHGRSFAFVGPDGALGVKLPSERIDALEAEGPTARLQLGTRLMREWASSPLDADSRERWALLLAEAVEFAALSFAVDGAESG